MFFFLSAIWKDVQDTPDVISRILMNVAVRTGIDLRAPVDLASCLLSFYLDHMDIESRILFRCGILWFIALTFGLRS